MTILHLGPSSPHVEHLKSVFSRFAPDVRQTTDCREEADLALVHNATDYRAVLEDALAYGPAVGWVWNDRFLTEPRYDREACVVALNRCALVVGDAESGAREVVPAEKWLGIRPMPWASVFHPPAPGAVRDIPVLVARGWNGHDLYWAKETKEALRGMEGVVYVDGKRTPGEMADLYRRSRCVVALREDAGPSYTVVEAALCGAVPVVSWTEANLRHFRDDESEYAAGIALRDPVSIRHEVLACKMEGGEMGYYNEARRERNLRYFASWTAEHQGPALVRRVLEVADGSR